MKYKKVVPGPFRAWQPSTWPKAPAKYDKNFSDVLQRIFNDSLLIEIQNVISDAPTLEHRGHVVALSILCAIDALSSYAFRDINRDICTTCKRTDRVGPRYRQYIEGFFPVEYRQFAARIYNLYRNSITHSWNLFEAAMLPGNERIKEVNGTLVLGLKRLYTDLAASVQTFIVAMQNDAALQEAALFRYKELKLTARP